MHFLQPLRLPWVCLPIHWTIEEFPCKTQVKGSVEISWDIIQCAKSIKKCENTGGLFVSPPCQVSWQGDIAGHFCKDPFCCSHPASHTDFVMWRWCMHKNRCTSLGERLIVKSYGPPVALFAHYSLVAAWTGVNLSQMHMFWVTRRFHCDNVIAFFLAEFPYSPQPRDGHVSHGTAWQLFEVRNSAYIAAWWQHDHQILYSLATHIYILFKPLSFARYSHKEQRRTVHKLCHVRKPLAQHDVRRSAVHRACAICGKVYMIG